MTNRRQTIKEEREMKISEFERSARKVNELANKYLGAWKEYYDLKRFDFGNIEFCVIAQRADELLNQIPDDVTNFPWEIQFSWDAGAGEWRECMGTFITSVGEYKQARRRCRAGGSQENT